LAVHDPDLSCARFLAGHWLGRSQDLEIEELWLAPKGGVAEGVVRVMKDGAVHTLEYLLITAETDRVLLRFNHFNRDYSTWERNGPIELVLSKASEREMIFLTTDETPRHASEVGYKLTSPSELTSWIIPVGENLPARVTFDYKRVH
jgi:hypothetical protein